VSGIRDLSVTLFLAGVASTEPSPGAGATAALALAMGISCARKAIRISTLHDPQAAFDRADARLSLLGDQAIDGADRDAAGFERLIGALQQAHDTDGEAASRHAAIHAAAGDLVTIAEELIAIGEEARLLIEELRDQINPMMVNDVNAALMLIESNDRIQSSNATENRRHTV
jgi:formiminotetrahydrofolate cyclodeaminase